MPIYEFACLDCGYDFEQIQSFSDSSTPSCPNCQGRHVQRRISPPAIHFKGSGWYITDSKKAANSAAKNGKNGNGAGKSDDSTASSGADSSGADSGGKESKESKERKESSTGATAGTAD